jgi:hypothetical protein
MNWRYGSRDRTSALQAQNPEFNAIPPKTKAGRGLYRK